MTRLATILEKPEHAAALAPLAQSAQMEIHRRLAISVLESMAQEKMRQLEELGPAKRTVTIFALFGEKKQADRKTLQTELDSIRLRLAQERKHIVDAEHDIHHILHEWLIAHDEEYRQSAHIEKDFLGLRSDVEQLAGSLIDLLSRYGSTRNEIAVAYDTDAKMLSLVALSALERLTYSHELLTEAQTRFSGKIECLNRLLESPIYRELKLSQFNQLLPPDCRRGMDYTRLRENFENGAQLVKSAIDQLQDYIGKIDSVPTEMNNTLYNYRYQLWHEYITELSGEGNH